MRDGRRTSGVRGLRGGLEKRVNDVRLDALKAVDANAEQWSTAAQEGGYGARRRNKGWKVSWRNESLKRNLGLDYIMCCSMPDHDEKAQSKRVVLVRSP